MLAAASSRSDRTLEAVKLVFLLETKNQEYPESLKSYFKDVIKQTVALLDRPNEVASSAMPEAISLAVKLASDQELSDVIRSILADEVMSKEQAEHALSSLEAAFDTNRESAHFSREIYRSI